MTANDDNILTLDREASTVPFIKNNTMKYVTSFIILPVFCFSCSTTKDYLGSVKDREALEQTSIGIRNAFAKADIPGILSYHHSNVRKALGYTRIINGKDELEKDLESTFSRVKLKWVKNDVESLIFVDRTAIEITIFNIEVSPNDGSQPFISKGRSMIVYVKNRKSPSGWASIREVIQPATE